MYYVQYNHNLYLGHSGCLLTSIAIVLQFADQFHRQKVTGTENVATFPAVCCQGYFSDYLGHLAENNKLFKYFTGYIHPITQYAESY